MLRLISLISLLFTPAQDPEAIRLPTAPISCTSKVESSACKLTKGAFHSAQKTSTAMSSVEVVIADNEAFQQEFDRLKAGYSTALKSDPFAAEHSKLTLSSPFQRSILFELGDGGLISKVVVRVELFNQVKPDGMIPTRAKPTPVEFDRDSAMTWATYVMGYVEGCMQSRAHTLAEASEQRR
jgi:hypothetical protein